MKRLVLLGWLALAAWSSPANAEQKLKVVATFSILGDLVTCVGGDRVSVETLVGPGIDTHTYSPRPTDVKKLAEARVVFANGLGFETWLDRLIASSSSNSSVMQASRGVSVIKTISGAPNPHAWQSVSNAKIYVANIREALIAADPDSAETYKANAAVYTERLDRLDADIRQGIAGLPTSDRSFVTPHPAFAYFGAAYDVDFVALQNMSHEAETSAKAVANIVGAIQRKRVAAVFFESTGDRRLMEQIAHDTGTKLGGPLYSDTLSLPDGPAPTYVAMMQQNMRAIAAVFRDPT